jgi:hypothetical protein
VNSAIARAAVVVVAAVGAIPMLASPATASSDQITGGCQFVTDQPPTVVGGDETGVIGDLSETTKGVNFGIGAVVSCKIQVNGVDAPGTTFSYSGYGVQAGADPISFAATAYDDVVECQRVVYQDGVDTGWTCEEPTYLQVPPEWDPVALALWLVDNVAVYTVDPKVCPLLAAHPGTYGAITIGPDGDVYTPDPLDLWDGPVYDCPPYRNF